jgi:hypothetical protein
LNIGKQRTQELNDKLFNAKKGNLLDFKLDGSVSNTQTFEGVDYPKSIQTHAEIFGILDFGKRERRQVTNYNENQLYRQMAHQFSGPKREKKKEPKLPKFLRLPRLAAEASCGSLGVFLLQVQPDFPKEAFSRWVP